MNISDIYEKLGEINQDIKKYTNKLKDKKSTAESNIRNKQSLDVELKKYEKLYLELKNNRTLVMKDYDYLDLLKEKIKDTKEVLINIKYEILYDLFQDSEETKERYIKKEEHLNYLNNLYVDMLRNIKNNESENVKKVNDLLFEIKIKLDEYKFALSNYEMEQSQDNMDSIHDIYLRYSYLNTRLFEEKRISFNLFEKYDHLRYDIDFRPYKEYNIKNVKKKGELDQENGEENNEENIQNNEENESYVERENSSLEGSLEGSNAEGEGSLTKNN
jgi:hypothetical protein